MISAPVLCGAGCPMRRNPIAPVPHCAGSPLRLVLCGAIPLRRYISRMNPIQHSMLRRLRNWDYRKRAIYMITVVLANRRRPLLGVVRNAQMYPSALGLAVEQCWNDIPKYHPQIQILASQLMPEHFHGIPFVRERLNYHLGKVIQGFKIGCNHAYARLFPNDPLPPNTGLFAPGFQDTVLLHQDQLQNMIAYVHDNPRRLWEKMQHREYFTIRQVVDIPGVGTMQAVGNISLLERPVKLQVQISRGVFRYHRDSQNHSILNCVPDISTCEFEEEKAMLLEAAQHGSVLVSPCISDGEREIARAAFQAGDSLIVLLKQGFHPYFKPSGQYFDACAAGRLLLLAPVNWNFTTQKQDLTREKACILNRICQKIAGSGAAQIVYHGFTPDEIDRLVTEATTLSR